MNNNRQGWPPLNRQSSSSPDQSQQSYLLYQQKMKALGKVKYLNQLAQMEYEDKLTELHTKYSSKTKQSVQKKLRAKNQIAEFVEEEDQKLQQEFEELMDFKYGASKWKNFHFERDSAVKQEQYSFCSLCDDIYKQSKQDHERVCNYQELARSRLYYQQSLDRIKKSLKRLTSQQAVELCNLADRMGHSENISQELNEIMPMVRNDEVLNKIAAKLQQIQEQFY